jgi:thiol-disulfide isomerase/thioredoxin
MSPKAGIAIALAAIVLAIALVVRASMQPVEHANLAYTLDDMSGAKVSVAKFAGKPLVINLWATWCGPCLHELPAMDRLARDHAERGVEVVTLSTEARDHLRAFAEKHPVSTLNVYAADAGWLDVRGRPMTIVIDREGIVREVLIGARSYEELAHTLERWLRPAA